ncbi:MAG: A/G-specific adenine glycosylase [Eubacteriales bacterium]|nr:A/G-specific adenine glycosylase [Eubacteriales bacterium]
MTEQQRLAQAAGCLLHWYDSSRRILPWRENPEPYRVWVSEIMLQQTRVEAVKPYYERFLAEIPTISALAQVPEEQLMKLWEGLGYYSRARNLQRAAKVVCEEYGGRLPCTSKELNRLPGIGEYTAGAIASIAYGEVCTAVDGNVLRVISRILEKEWDIRSTAVKKAVTEMIVPVIPQERPGDFNQALMELGAMVCLPNGTPKCEGCPLAALCLSFQHQRQEEIPRKAAKKARPIEQRVVYLLFREGRVALRRRPSNGLLSGMWEFPNFLETEEPDIGIAPFHLREGKKAKHIFSHLEWHMTGMIAQVKEEGAFHWASAEELQEEIALPSAFRVFRRQALQVLTEGRREKE